MTEVLDDGFEDLVDWSGPFTLVEWWRRRRATTEVLAMSVREKDVKGDVNSGGNPIFLPGTFGCDLVDVDEINLNGFIGFVGQLNAISDTVDALVCQVPSLSVQFGVQFFIEETVARLQDLLLDRIVFYGFLCIRR